MSYSFGIKNSIDLYREFKLRCDDYRKNTMSSGCAVICAILSWHIAEWLFNEHSKIKINHKDIFTFQKHMKTKCPSLLYMQDIANGNKHRGITRYEPIVKNTIINNGAFSSGLSNGFDIPKLKIEIENNVFIYFDEELEKIEHYFDDFFSKSE